MLVTRGALSTFAGTGILLPTTGDKVVGTEGGIRVPITYLPYRTSICVVR
jgi:hypothetical protein